MEPKKKLGWIIVAAFIVGFAISWIVLGMKATAPGESAVSSSTQSLVDGSNAVSVSNQLPGLTAIIDSVSLGASGWVAIHEDRDGNPGNILGAVWLPEGTHKTVPVELLRATVPTNMYYAVLHSDDGDKTFDYKIDTPINDSAGAPIAVQFFVEKAAQ